jgi:hypothetical protein
MNVIRWIKIMIYYGKWELYFINPLIYIYAKYDMIEYFNKKNCSLQGNSLVNMYHDNNICMQQ